LIGQKSIQGNLDYSIQAELPLNKPNLENLAGKGSFTLKDGVIQKINLGLFIDDLKNTSSTLIKGEITAIKAEQFDMTKYNQGETPFKLINIQYQLHQAELVTESFILQTDTLQIKGGGNLNLNNHNIQSHLLLTVADNQNASQNIQQLLGGGFPILLQGTLGKPELLPDLTIINEALNKFPIKDAIKKPLKHSKKELATLLH
jgi:AsmA protein